MSLSKIGLPIGPSWWCKHYFLGRNDGKRQRLFNGDYGQHVFLRRNLVEVYSKGNYLSSSH
jgi:hypothetical protein